MAKLVWDETGKRLYETGVSKGVLYVQADDGTYGNGVAWNGLTAVNESPSGAEATPLYADDIKYLELTSTEEYGASIEAYTYPEEFEQCDGSAELGAGVIIGQQPRKAFGFCYRTLIGNDVKNNDYGYKIHIVYGAKAAPSEKAYQTVNDSPEAITFSWELTTTPVNVAGHKPTACVTIDSTKVDAAKLTSIEEALYGSDTAEPKLLLPDEIAAIIKAA
nr:MAG TPA: tail tube protein [Caudoviricetes sp.]